MFNFFRKKEKFVEFNEKELVFFRKLTEVLPIKYSYLRPQINKEFLLGFMPNPIDRENSYNVVMNSIFEKKYLKTNLPKYFILKDIRLWDKKKERYFTINLDITSGILAGFKIENLDFENFDFDKTDLSQLYEKHFENEDFNKFLQNFSQIEKNILKDNMNTTYTIDFGSSCFYFFDDIGNGDVIVLNSLGDSFILTHDPSRIIPLFDRLDFFEKLQSKSLFNEALIVYNNL